MSRVAILYPGALGGALGKAIAVAGGSAITCLVGRSLTTREHARAANIVAVPSIEELARDCDIVVSLVPPPSALEAARNFAVCAEAQYMGNAAKPPFIEANSVAVRTKMQIAEVLSAVGIPCLDGAFLGPADRIGAENVMLLSGPGAIRVAPIFQKVIEVRVVGDEIGQASSLKMTMAILTKALPALFLEMVYASAKRGQLDSALDLMRRLYPGITAFLERTLPTYPKHIVRRVFELREVRDWLRELGEIAVMTEGAVTVLERLRLRELSSNVDWRFEDLVRTIGECDLLSSDKRGARDSDPAGEPSQTSIVK